jgi:hypothetical protein
MNPEKDFELERAQDAQLDQALRNFRASVQAWSEAEFSRPRRMQAAVLHRSWRLAVGWALGVVLVAGGVSGGVYDRHLRKMERIEAAQREAEHQRVLAAQKAHAEEELAKVDKDVSRDVPSAMEPLAQLMGEDDTQ